MRSESGLLPYLFDRALQAAAGRSSRVHSSTRCSERPQVQPRSNGFGRERVASLAAAVVDDADVALAALLVAAGERVQPGVVRI